MGSAWIVNTADLSETSRPPSTTKTFPKGPIRSSLSCADDVSARIGDQRQKEKKSVKYRRRSKKCLEEMCEIVLDGELFFYL